MDKKQQDFGPLIVGLILVLLYFIFGMDGPDYLRAILNSDH